MRHALALALALAACSDDEPPCNDAFNTCTAAHASARTTCERMHDCALLFCPGTDETGEGVCTLQEALDACIEEKVAMLCAAAECDAHGYAGQQQLDACRQSVEQTSCPPMLCPL